MVFIKYPLDNYDADADLAAWRAKNPKAEGDWVDLKEYLAKQPRIFSGLHAMPKCWYTELPMGDNISIDIEHFRPKNSALPLSTKQVDQIEAIVGYDFYQNTSSSNYKWLKFDHRNYRLTTGFTNRGGGKVDYFPIALGSQRLTDPKLPWLTAEYNLLLDPTDPHDANQLLVLPNGTIVPRAPKTALTIADFNNYAALWGQDGFNFLRAAVTIVLYRLDYNVLVTGRAEVFQKTTESIPNLIFAQNSDLPQAAKEFFIKQLFNSILPSAPFALAARSALNAYIPITGMEADFETLKSTIYQRLNNEINAKIADWNKP